MHFALIVLRDTVKETFLSEHSGALWQSHLHQQRFLLLGPKSLHSEWLQ